MYVYSLQVRVRYAETDQMKYVYYGNYAMYFEVARVETLRNLGCHYKDLENIENVMMPVLENYSRYLRPAYYDDLLTIQVKIAEKPTAKIRFNYEIFNPENTLIHEGYTVLAFLNTQTHKPTRCPSILLNLLEPYFI
jgi:acyl-CoA thioester hydrolase